MSHFDSSSTLHLCYFPGTLSTLWSLRRWSRSNWGSQYNLVTRLCSSKGWKMIILMRMMMIWWLRALSLLLRSILLGKIYIFTDLAPKSIQTRNCVGNVVWRIFRSGQRGESTRRHSFMIIVGNICQKKNCAKKQKFILFIQVEFSWTKNGRFIDTTTGHVHFESKDNGESFGLENNENIPLGIMILSPITREHHHLQCRARWRGSLSVYCLQFWGSCVLQG